MEKNNQENLATQENLAKMYQEQQNMFWEKIQKDLKSMKEKNTLISDLNAIYLKLTQTYEELTLTTEDYSLLGSLAYLVGIDFTSNFANKTVQENVRKRFEALNINTDECSVFADCIALVTEKTIIQPKEILKNRVSTVVSGVEIHDLSVLRGKILKVIDHSIFPISMANAIEELRVKNLKLTYQDFLKINSLLQVQCKFHGYQIQNIIDIYNDKSYQFILNKAKVNFDDQKFSVIYLDSILTVNEVINFSEIYGETNLLKSVLLNKELNELVSEDKKENVDETTENKEEEFIVEWKSSKTDDEINVLMTDLPDEFFVEVIKDLNKSDEISTNSIAKTLNEFYESSEDFGQHMYSYLKSNVTSEKRNLNFEILYPGINLSDLLTLLNNEFEESKLEYKTNVENICKPIPENILGKVTDRINSTIKTLVLVDDNQKQYLISQIVENQIKTFKQLQQVLGLIESCDTTSSREYFELFTFLKENTEISEIFVESEKVEPLKLRLSYIQLLLDWFKKFETKVEPVVTEIENKIEEK